MNESTEPSYFQLVYVSQAMDDLTYNDLSMILGRSRDNNLRDGITGLLIHKDGFFIQMLEARSESLVKRTLGRIVQDPRHKMVRVIGEWTHQKRFFTSWSMAFHDQDIDSNIHPFIQKIFSDTMLVTLPTRSDFIGFFEDFSKKAELK